MEVLTTTPFGQRPVTAELISQVQAMRSGDVPAQVHKWEVLRALTTARKTYGLNAGALTVLNALLSFHKGDQLTNDGALVVFPSNRTLSSRAHGMPESTLRRNLGLLVNAGLVLRHDSPNGKRYAVRAKGGDIARAFGFDLRPLLVNAAEIFSAADDATTEADRLKRAREKIALMKRDCWKLLEYVRTEQIPGPWETLQDALEAAQKRLRRVLRLDQLQSLCDALSEALLRFESLLTAKASAPAKTTEMSASDSQNERHIQNSNKNTFESEESLEKTTAEATAQNGQGDDQDQLPPKEETHDRVPISLVHQACPDLAPYAQTPIRNGHQLVETAFVLHRMMGISPDVWQNAMRTMGPEGASVTLACILQRVGQIKNPGGYLRALTKKAETGAFSVWPMVRALLGTAETAKC